jgi:hypothetical protein
VAGNFNRGDAREENMSQDPYTPYLGDRPAIDPSVLIDQQVYATFEGLNKLHHSLYNACRYDEAERARQMALDVRAMHSEAQ